MKNVKITNPGSLEYENERYYNARANFPLLIIKKAWENGCDFEDLADGFGKGHGTMGGDWSGIRDSSDDATNKMLERAFNFIDGRLEMAQKYLKAKAKGEGH